MSEEGGKSIFKVPQTLGELEGHLHENKWTLACDAGLIHVIKAMSENVKARMKQVSDDIDDVVFDVKATDAFVHNTFNKFLMLSQMQFVENRVYDEEEPKADAEVAAAQPEVAPESRERVLVPLYTEIIKSSTSSLTQRMQLVQEAGEFEDETMMPLDFELKGNKFCRSEELV